MKKNRILCISNTHTRHKELDTRIAELSANEPIDIIIHCGGTVKFTRNMRGMVNEFYKFISWFETLNCPNKILIGSSTDLVLDSNIYNKSNEVIKDLQKSGITYLYDETIEINGLQIYGNGASCIPGFAFAEQCNWKNIPTDVDIIITHVPPIGILDIVGEKSGNKDLLQQIIEIMKTSDKYSRVHIFGYINEGYGRKVGRICNATNDERITRFVNCALLNDEKLHDPVIVTINE